MNVLRNINSLVQMIESCINFGNPDKTMTLYRSDPLCENKTFREIILRYACI